MFSPAPQRPASGGSRRTSYGLRAGTGTPGPTTTTTTTVGRGGMRTRSRAVLARLTTPAEGRGDVEMGVEGEGEGEVGVSGVGVGVSEEEAMEVDRDILGTGARTGVGAGVGASGSRTRESTGVAGGVAGVGAPATGPPSGSNVGVRKHKGAVAFAQSEEMVVLLSSAVPVEVQTVLRSADFSRDDEFTGSILSSEYSFIASHRTCFVWKHSQNLLVTPTCYIFPCPQDDPSSNYVYTTPFGALVQFDSSREPGLVLLSRGGMLMFWDSVGLGLTGGEQTDVSVLALQSGEGVTGLISTDSQTFIATTTNGRLFLLTVTSTPGKFRVSHRPFTYAKPQLGAFSVLKQLWTPNVPLNASGSITAAAVVQAGRTKEAYCVVTCVERCLVKWVAREGWEEISDPVEVADAITAAVLKEHTGVLPQSGTLDLEFDDICFNETSPNPILLVSFAGVDDESGIDYRPRRFYTVVQLNASSEGKYSVTSVRSVPYQTISTDRANIQPRLRLLEGGAVYCVQFGDAVALVASVSQYSTVLSLKSLQDRTFGCGVLKNEPVMLFMNSDGLMRVELDLKKIAAFDPATGKASSIKSIMTQAILFGSNPKNPLLFAFPPDVDEESLISGAEQLSRAVLASDNEIVRANPDLTRQILERKERLRFLIGFINENAALGKMSQSSRQRLAIDAEILYAAQQLWAYYCQRLNEGRQERILPVAIQEFMDDSGEGYHEDTMRAFFRLQTRDLGQLMPFVVQYLNETLSNWEALEQLPDALPRANNILLVILESAWAFRDTNEGVYGLSPPLIRAWTSTPAIIDIAVDLFNRSAKFVEEAEPEDGDAQGINTEVVGETKNQLPDLAAAVFRSCREREEWLESHIAAEEAGIENEKRTFKESFQQLRPTILQALLRLDLGASAFKIAETYRDFRSLVELCYTTTPVFPLSSNPNVTRIEFYIETYKEEFTEELFQYYIENRELRSLFALSDVYTGYVDSFFAKHPHSSLSWIHNLGKSRWEVASATLLKEANQTSDLTTRHIMLSIGKLSQLAHTAQTGSESRIATLEAFHDSLDYISVHQKLADELREPLKGAKSRQSLENQVDAVAKASAKRLKPYPAFLALYRSCVRNVLQGHVLGLEDMVDILTLKDKADDHAIALQLIKTATDIPEGRRSSAFRTVWRRIYIHDNWQDIRQTVNTTDDQLTAKFKKTSLFSTVRDALENDSGSSSSILSLDDAVLLPTEEELASRWPGHSEDQIAELLADYREEKRRLEDMDLQPIVERVKELVVQEMETHDVEMQ